MPGSHKTARADRSCHQRLEEHFCSRAALAGEFLAAPAAEKHLQNWKGTCALSARPSIHPSLQTRSDQHRDGAGSTHFSARRVAAGCSPELRQVVL